MGLMTWLRARPQKAGSYVKNVIGMDSIKNGGDAIRESVNSLKPKPSRTESFENACARLGLDENGLLEAYRFQMNRFLMFSAFMGFGVVVGGWVAYDRGALSAGVLAVFALIMAAQMMNASFRMYQIRSRELCDLAEWTARPGEWWPKDLVVAPVRKSRKRDGKR